MVLNKSFKVLRRWRPSRSVLLESKTILEESLLFESGTLSVLSKENLQTLVYFISKIVYNYYCSHELSHVDCFFTVYVV